MVTIARMVETKPKDKARVSLMETAVQELVVCVAWRWNRLRIGLVMFEFGEYLMAGGFVSLMRGVCVCINEDLNGLLIFGGHVCLIR